MRAVSFIGILVSFAVAGLAVAADEGTVYLWVDKDGTPHYQDRPPEGSGTDNAQELSLRYKMTDSQAVAAESKRKSELATAADLRERQQAEDKSTEQAEREQVASEREKGCQEAREKLTKYETAHRLYKPGPDGQRTYLTDEEIDAARVAARQTVEEWCGE
jgi:hypothetical protein